MIKVSIIIPIYNVEAYLRKCLDSVIKQTFKDIEIILINDGSSDNSLNICKEYSNKDKRIKIIDKRNEGVSKARNVGLLCARGEYISFVDSDDWIELNMIEELYNSVSSNNAEFCMSNYIRENESKSQYVDANIELKKLQDNEIKEYLLIPLIERENNQKEHILASFRGPWGKLFKRDIIEKYNIKFKKDLIVGEDFIFNLEFLVYINKAVINEGFYYHYLTNSNSITMKYKKDCWRLIYRNTILYLEDFLKKNNLYLEAKDKVNKLIIKYFLMSVINEGSKDNIKIKVEKINTIKEMCEDKIIMDALESVDLNLYGKKNNFILFLAKYRLKYLIYIFSVM
ncbi:glycosyltransferase family 2 protein [Clostridium pasteurianum]|uniref:Glycosyl transferase n=1 Tax=Clostridium pasteurianum BC1 TaxID=86416 RepID=R4K2B0_CLOPA|nr:glycosyltransferase [Clostridium pasteurianum]AGK95886.1 glycosyl transferase [Clostridium pasteurianum BC1]